MTEPRLEVLKDPTSSCTIPLQITSQGHDRSRTDQLYQTLCCKTLQLLPTKSRIKSTRKRRENVVDHRRGEPRRGALERVRAANLPALKRARFVVSSREATARRETRVIGVMPQPQLKLVLKVAGGETRQDDPQRADPAADPLEEMVYRLSKRRNYHAHTSREESALLEIDATTHTLGMQLLRVNPRERQARSPRRTGARAKVKAVTTDLHP
jgi:hypothetical protein